MTYTVDLWSAGTIIYQMVTKDPPFNGANHIELLKKIENCKRLRFPPGLSDNCKDLIIRLLKRNPIQRISWDSFFKHPWLNPIINDNHKSSSPSNSMTPRTKYKNTIPTPYEVADSDSTSTTTTTTTPVQPKKIKKATPNPNPTPTPNPNPSKPKPKPTPTPTSPSMSPSKPPHSRSQSQSPTKQIPRLKPLQLATGGTPEFVMIDNGPNSANSSRQPSINTPTSSNTPKIVSMNSKVYIEFLNKCSVTFNDISIKYEYAKCIMKVGDVQTSREQISCALLLYLRGLDILEDIIITIQTWIQVYTASHKYYHSKFKNKKNMKQLLKDNGVDDVDTTPQNKLDEFSLRYKQLLLESIGCYDDHWKRGEAIQTLCATQHLDFDLNQVNIDEVIFYFAIETAKKSCSDVILNIDQNDDEKNAEMDDKGMDNQYSSNNKIRQSKILLEYLLTLDSIENDDKSEIENYLIAIDNTLTAIENL